MKNSKCDDFNTEIYHTFSEILSSFYQRGGTDIDLITNILYTPYKFLDCMYNHMRSNPSAYKDNVDSFGFSALYYWKLKPIEISKKSALETLGFKELYPNTYKIYHLKDHSYYSHSIDRAEIVFVFLGDDDDKGALDTDTVHKLFMSGFNRPLA